MGDRVASTACLTMDDVDTTIVAAANEIFLAFAETLRRTDEPVAEIVPNTQPPVSF